MQIQQDTFKANDGTSNVRRDRKKIFSVPSYRADRVEKLDISVVYTPNMDRQNNYFNSRSKSKSREKRYLSVTQFKQDNFSHKYDSTLTTDEFSIAQFTNRLFKKQQTKRSNFLIEEMSQISRFLTKKIEKQKTNQNSSVRRKRCLELNRGKKQKTLKRVETPVDKLFQLLTPRTSKQKQPEKKSPYINIQQFKKKQKDKKFLNVCQTLRKNNIKRNNELN